MGGTNLFSLILKRRFWTAIAGLAVAGAGAWTWTHHRLDRELRPLFERHGIAALPGPEFQDAPEVVELGRHLFFDKILSGNRNISCGTCHHPSLASADLNSLSIGEGGKGLGRDRKTYGALTTLRNAPALFNLGYKDIPHLFWDGRVELDAGKGTLRSPASEISSDHRSRIPSLVESLGSALEIQVLIPMTDFAEMRGKRSENELAAAHSKAEVWSLIIKRLVGADEDPASGLSGYKEMFAKAFPDVKVPGEITPSHLSKALAGFIRQTFRADSTPLDEYLRGDSLALDLESKRGALLFAGKARCAECHSGRHLSSFEFASLAVPQIGPGNVMTAWDEGGYTRGISLNTTDDFGRYGVTLAPEDRFRFRVPPLRQVADTGPWMHDGAFTRLESVLDHLLDPAESLRAYRGDGIKRKEFLQNMNVNKKHDRDRLATLDPRAKIPALTESEKKALLRFLTFGLRDPNALDPEKLRVPASVPSGIDVQD